MLMSNHILLTLIRVAFVIL